MIEGRAAWPDGYQSAPSWGEGRILKYGFIHLGGVGGVRFMHGIGHKNYFPMIAILAKPTEVVGDICFDIQTSWLVVYNNGPGLGRAMIILVDVSDAPMQP